MVTTIKLFIKSFPWYIKTLFSGLVLVVAWLVIDIFLLMPTLSGAIAIPDLVTRGRYLDSVIAADIRTRDSLRNQFFKLLSVEAGAKYNVNATVLYAIWVRESLLDPNAKGDGDKDSNGVFIPGTWRAFGIGQIHLSTARSHFDGPVTPDMLYDPVFNGFVSAKVLSDYLKLADGDYVYAISSYQQGPVGALQQKKKKEIPKNWNSYVYPVLKIALILDQHHDTPT